MYTVQFSGNLSRKGIARQVAERIAQCKCNRALKVWASEQSPIPPPSVNLDGNSRLQYFNLLAVRILKLSVSDGPFP